MEVMSTGVGGHRCPATSELGERKGQVVFDRCQGVYELLHELGFPNDAQCAIREPYSAYTLGHRRWVADISSNTHNMAPKHSGEVLILILPAHAYETCPSHKRCRKQRGGSAEARNVYLGKLEGEPRYFWLQGTRPEPSGGVENYIAAVAGSRR